MGYSLDCHGQFIGFDHLPSYYMCIDRYMDLDQIPVQRSLTSAELLYYGKKNPCKYIHVICGIISFHPMYIFLFCWDKSLSLKYMQYMLCLKRKGLLLPRADISSSLVPQRFHPEVCCSFAMRGIIEVYARVIYSVCREKWHSFITFKDT